MKDRDRMVRILFLQIPLRNMGIPYSTAKIPIIILIFFFNSNLSSFWVFFCFFVLLVI